MEMLHPLTVDNLVIRELEERDLVALEWNGEFTHYRNLYRTIYGKTINGDIKMWVAEIAQIGIVGQLFLQYTYKEKNPHIAYDYVYFFSVRVKPQFRNRGIGTSLLRNAEQHSINKGFQYAMLFVARDNIRAKRFYENLGYCVICPIDGKWSYVNHLGKVVYVNEPSWKMLKRLTE